MRIRSIDLSHGRFFARLPNFLELKPTLARLVSQPLPSFPMHDRGTKTTWGVLDDSPVIINWNGLQAEITPTLETSNNWIIFTHPVGAEDAATPTPPIPKGAQRILDTKGEAGRERGWRRTGTDKLASYGLETEVWISQNSTIPDSNIIALGLTAFFLSHFFFPKKKSKRCERKPPIISNLNP